MNRGRVQLTIPVSKIVPKEPAERAAWFEANTPYTVNNVIVNLEGSYALWAEWGALITDGGVVCIQDNQLASIVEYAAGVVKVNGPTVVIDADDFLQKEIEETRLVLAQAYKMLMEMPCSEWVKTPQPPICNQLHTNTLLISRYPKLEEKKVAVDAYILTRIKIREQKAIVTKAERIFKEADQAWADAYERREAVKNEVAMATAILGSLERELELL